MSSSPTPRRPDFSHKAARYDELRPVDENWWLIFETLVREGDLRGRRVLDVGCGTGRFAAALAPQARVWGVDASPEMLAVARTRVPRGVGLKLGRAEELPFKSGYFDRAVLNLVVHLVDRPRAFRELRRVLAPGGLVAIASFDASYFGGYWLNAFFPSLAVIDRARFPAAEDLSAELTEAGFSPPRLLRLSGRGRHEREAALERVRGRHISTLDLLDEAEYAAGLERAERELPEVIEYSIEWLLAFAAAGSS